MEGGEREEKTERREEWREGGGGRGGRKRKERWFFEGEKNYLITSLMHVMSSLPYMVTLMLLTDG